MPKGATFAAGIAGLIFKGASISGIAQNASSPTTTFYIALHTDDPAGGEQSTNEIAYTGYARQAVARDTGFVQSGNQVQFAAPIDFPLSSGGTPTARYFSIGTASSGTGMRMYSGPILPAMKISAVVANRLKAETAIGEY